VRTIDQLLSEIPVFASIGPENICTIAGCGRNAVFDDGDYLMREGDPAEQFFVIRHGTVAVETFSPPRGPITIQTYAAGDILGWSWLIPPHRMAFDYRAMGSARVVCFDGVCLRAKCDSDLVLANDMLKLVSGVVVRRLQNTIVQLLDVYGTVPDR
jgi:CRP/FNR family cyclic AMP-dependent transcriptional regulator